MKISWTKRHYNLDRNGYPVLSEVTGHLGTLLGVVKDSKDNTILVVTDGLGNIYDVNVEEDAATVYGNTENK